jgi:hypothetical protein
MIPLPNRDTTVTFKRRSHWPRPRFPWWSGNRPTRLRARMRVHRQLVVGAAVAALCACGVAAVPSASPTGTVDLRQPSVADLLQFAPGGVDMSSTADKNAGAPLICGGSRPAALVDAAIVGIPGSLADVSVVNYRFSSKDAAAAYFEAIRSQASMVPPGQCKAPAPNSGVFSAVSLFAFKGQPQVDASGTTAFPTGPYAGAMQYNVLQLLREGIDVFEIRIDRQTRYADISFEEAIERLMNHGTAKIPDTGAHSAQPSHVDGVLQLGTYMCCMEKTPPVGPIGAWARSRDMTCPELLVGGTPYTIEMENQLENVSATGMVAYSSSGPATKVHWGQRVSALVDTFGEATAFGCYVGNSNTAMQANVLSISANP